MSCDSDLGFAHMILDDYGNKHQPAIKNPRIVSLVPSITELLFSLGIGACVVGRTGFCVHPKTSLKPIMKVGGTKDIDFAKIKALKPTHVIVNIDENTLEIYDFLVSEIENVIVTHPKKASDNTRLFAMLGEIFHAQEKARDLILEFENKLDKLTSYTKHLEQLKVLYLIWRDPWMTVSKDTYISEMLRIINCHTVPTYSSSRYPSLSDEELYDLQIDACFLSTEPYPFRDKHLLELELKFDWFEKIQLIDGEMLSWYGSRAILGLDYLGTLAQTLNSNKSTSLWK